MQSLPPRRTRTSGTWEHFELQVSLQVAHHADVTAYSIFSKEKGWVFEEMKHDRIMREEQG